jgi:hypothetical protein
VKFLARSLGLLLVAAGFVGLVIDGTRSIVNNVISFTSLGSLIGMVSPDTLPRWQTSLTQRFDPWVWDTLATHLLQVPASVSGFLLGAFLLWLGQKSMEPIGYMAGR